MSIVLFFQAELDIILDLHNYFQHFPFPENVHLMLLGPTYPIFALQK